MKRCAEWQKRLSQFKQHRRTLTVYWGKQDFRCSKSRNVSLKFSCRIWFGILCETSIKKKVIWSAKLICLPRVIFWTNWKTTLIVIRLYAFFPALSQWWGYVYLHCVFIGSLNFSLSYDWPLLPGLKWFFCAQFNTEELLPLLVETKHLVQKHERNTGSKITSCDINVPAVMSCTRIVISQEDIVEPVWYNTFCVH